MDAVSVKKEMLEESEQPNEVKDKQEGKMTRTPQIVMEIEIASASCIPIANIVALTIHWMTRNMWM